MTNDELQAIREREARATPGPWESNSCGLVKGGEMLDEIADTTWDLNEWQSNCNAEFIAHARQDIPALLAEIDRLKRGDFTEEGGKEMIPSDPLHNLFCRIAADRELVDNVIVHCGLQTWRHSNQSQEEVLAVIIETIRCLIRQNTALLETVVKISERSVQPIIVPPKSP